MEGEIVGESFVGVDCEAVGVAGDEVGRFVLTLFGSDGVC